MHPDLVGAVGVLRGDEVHCQFALLPVRLVVELVAEREVLPVLGVPQLGGPDDVPGEDLGQPGTDLGCVDVDVLDLLLDDLFLVGEVLVQGAVALHVGLGLQQGQRLLHPFGEVRQVQTEAVVHQHGQVAGGGVEPLDVLHEEQGLEETDRELVLQIAFSDIDGALRRRLQRRTYAGEHLVEGRQRADLDVADLFRDLLDHAQHGPFPDGTVAALEHVVVRDPLDRGLEQGELVGDERVGAHEVRPVGVVAVRLGAVDEVEQGLEVRGLGVVDPLQFRLTGGVLLQQAFADDLFHVGAGELHLGGEPGLDLGEVVALLLGAVPHDLVHVLLGGDEHPRPSLALRVQGLGDRLQVEHQFGVRADELADLVDEEVQPVGGFLPVQPGLDLLSEVLDGHRVLGAVFGEDVRRCRVGGAADLGVRLRDVHLLQDALFAALRPVPAGDPRVRLLEGVVLATVVQVAFEPGDVPLVAVVAAGVVEHLDEHLQQGIGLVLGDQGGLLIDVEQQALRRDTRGLAQQCGQERVRGFGEEAVRDLRPVERLALHVAQQVGQHLQQVGLAGAEEPRDPHPVRVGVLGVRLKELLDTFGGLVGQDVLLDLLAQVGGVIRFDDPFDGALDVLGEDLIELHGGHGSCSRMFLAR